MQKSLLRFNKLTVALACESVSTDSDLHVDSLFGISLPTIVASASNARSQHLLAIGHRCMHDACWFPPARAYTVGVYMDPAIRNRSAASGVDFADVARTTSCPKSFVLYFASSKDLKHIRKGFERSYTGFLRTHPTSQDATDLIHDFLAIFADRTSLSRDDQLRISCHPSSNSVEVCLRGSPPIIINNAEPLIAWLHHMYLGLGPESPARYPGMQRELLTDLNDKPASGYYKPPI